MSASALAQNASDKKIWQEPSFYLSESMKWADVAISQGVIDGRRLKEGNPIFVRRDGGLNLPVAIGANLGSTAVMWYAYEKNPKWARRIMWGVAAFKGFFVVRAIRLNRNR
jgi:hypothetical protein